jgi:hypothetical protein
MNDLVILEEVEMLHARVIIVRALTYHSNSEVVAIRIPAFLPVQEFK